MSQFTSVTSLYVGIIFDAEKSEFNYQETDHRENIYVLIIFEHYRTFKIELGCFGLKE